MIVKVKFKAIKYHGGSTTFVENIYVPDDLTTVEEQDDYINGLDKSEIMYTRNLHGIIDFFRYVKKQKSEKKPTWKDVAKKWEEACILAQDNSSTWEARAMAWKKIALEYKAALSGKYFEENIDPIEGTVDVIETKENSVDTGLPVDITKNYSGGWLAPNGDFYGMDGDYVDMIHQQLGDKLLELGLVPKEEDGFHNPDSWLCDNGWAKIHFDWILYDGYLIAKRTKTQNDFNMSIINAIPMTDAQRNKIVLYGKLCCNGILKFGIQKTQMTAVRFEMIESPMIWKLFDY